LADAVVCRWCGNRLDDPVAVLALRRVAPTVGLGLGGILVAVSPVLPWLNVVLLGNLDLFDAANLAQSGRLPLVLLPIALVACGIAAVIAGIGLRQGLAARLTAVVLLIVAGVLGGLLLAGLLQAIPNTLGLAHIGVGPWIDLAGAFVMLAGAIVPPPRPVASLRPAGYVVGRATLSAVVCSVVVVLAALGLVALARLGDANSSPVVRAGATPSAPLSKTPGPQSTNTEATIVTALPPIRSSSPASTRGGLTDAEELVQAKGFRPNPNTTWERPGGLQVILAVAADSGDGDADLAFFFYDGKYLGTDTSSTSAVIQEVWSTGDTIALSYQLYNPDDPMCCPTASAATVRYQWVGSRLIPLDTVPSDDPSAALSRR
jgi:hypothetical protein